MPFEGVGTMFFVDKKAEPSSGWSETFWLTGTDYSMAGTNMTALSTARLALLTDSVELVAMRVSDRTVRGDSMLIPTVGFGTTLPGTYGSPGAASASPWTAVLLRVEATALYRAVRWLHGVPVDGISGEKFVPTTTWETNFDAFVTALEANARLRVRDKTVPEPRPFIYRTITAVVHERLGKKNVGRPFDLSHGRRLIR